MGEEESGKVSSGWKADAGVGTGPELGRTAEVWPGDATDSGRDPSPERVTGMGGDDGDKTGGETLGGAIEVDPSCITPDGMVVEFLALLGASGNRGETGPHPKGPEEGGRSSSQPPPP